MTTTTARVGLIGDRSEAVRAHRAIPRAFALLAAEGGPAVELVWLPTARLADPDAALLLAPLDGLWCVPGSPYASLDGALLAIRHARLRGRPFLGTCGGFQHALLEVTRNVVGVAAADHAESNPDAALPLIERMACSLAGARGRVHVQAGSRLAAAYGAPDDVAVEAYQCNYGLNPAHRGLIDASPLRVVAVDDYGEVRGVELRDHPFFVATLFQPELAALEDRIHPLIRAFAGAVCAGMGNGGPAR